METSRETTTLLRARESERGNGGRVKSIFQLSGGVIANTCNLSVGQGKKDGFILDRSKNLNGIRM